MEYVHEFSPSHISVITEAEYQKALATIKQYRAQIDKEVEDVLYDEQNPYIQDTDISVRVLNILAAGLDEWDRQKGGVRLSRIAALTKRDFLRMRHAGKKSLNELENILSKHGKKFKYSE